VVGVGVGLLYRQLVYIMQRVISFVLCNGGLEDFLKRHV
jgi:hypothetical protein